MFGVTSASEEYNHIITNLFLVCPGVVSIFDDIIVFGKDKSEHDKNLDIFFKTLIQNGITANPKKCLFGVNEIEFFGFRISKDGIHPTESKTAAIQAFKTPNNITELRSFLGMVTYLSDFIPHLATLLDPLRELTQKNIPFIWTPEKQNSFDNIKQVLSSDLQLAYFSIDNPTSVIVDASPVGLGAILIQTDKNGIRKPIPHASRSLTTTERKYCQTEK